MYKDLVKCWEHVRDTFSYIDTDNGVALGGSFGGFMINWIQGNDLGRKFKALMSHDGIFLAEGNISSDELWFMEYNVRVYFCINSFLVLPLQLPFVVLFSLRFVL